ncbi:MAG: hypothetical protein HYV63_05295 [Candidatus Schekmanbacteria bacterium]|nr:hypothetical protein [Candidatus Schekmanbacteria bacterium]
MVNLIGNAATREGLEIKAALDERMHAAGVKGSDEEITGLVVERDEFHGEGSYRLKPRVPAV